MGKVAPSAEICTLLKRARRRTRASPGPGTSGQPNQVTRLRAGFSTLSL